MGGKNLLGKIVKQQKILAINHIKLIFFLISVSMFLGITSTFKIKLSHELTIALFNRIFNRYTFCFIVFPVQIISVLSIFQIRIHDIYACQRKQIIVYQMIATSMFVVGAFYLLANVSIVAFNLAINGIWVFNYLPPFSYFLAMISGGTVSLTYCLVTLLVSLLTDNKTLAFVVTFVFNLTMFILSVNNRFKLFYSFTNMVSVIENLANLLLLLALIGGLFIIIENIVNEKEFL